MQNSAEFSWESDDITDCKASSVGSLYHTCIKPTPHLSLSLSLSPSVSLSPSLTVGYGLRLLKHFVLLLGFNSNQDFHQMKSLFSRRTILGSYLDIFGLVL